MSQKKAELLLILAIGLRSVSFLFSKTALQDLEPLTLMMIRFLLGFAVLTVIFYKRMMQMNRKTFLHGMTLGVIFFCCMTLELYGLRSTSTSVTSFLENTAIVFVPILSKILFRTKTTLGTWISSGVALLGVGVLTLKNGAFQLSSGEMLVLGAALFYAMGVIATDRFTKEDDPVVLGILQNGFVGLLAVPAAFLMETPKMPTSQMTWASILALVFVCTVVGFTLQPVAQKHTTAERAGLFCAVNPLVAMVLGVTVLHESLGWTGIVGAVLIVGSIFLSKVGTKIEDAFRTKSEAKGMQLSAGKSHAVR